MVLCANKAGKYTMDWCDRP